MALVAAAIGYLVVCVVLYSLQTQMIFPGAGSQGQPSAIVRSGPHDRVLELTASDGAKIAALFGGALTPGGGPRDDAATRPTILYCYGNGMCLSDCRPIFNELRTLGFNVIIPEYEGYGMSGGRAGEQGCYFAAGAAYDWLLKNPDIDPHRIVAAGWSLGAAVAIDLATRRPVAGVAAFSAFTSMRDMGRNLFPWLPVSLLIRHRFDNLRKIAELKCPILLVHGAQDDLVPPAMCDRLAAAGGAKVQRIVVPRAGHVDIFDVGGDDLLKQFRRFAESLPPVAPSGGAPGFAGNGAI